jgi:DNA modification methylase
MKKKVKRRRQWREEQIGNCRLILADYREVIGSLPPIDLLFTSPPYANQRTYGGHDALKDWRALMSGIQNTPVAEHTQVLVNLGVVRKNNEVFEYWDGWKQDMRKAGWRFFDLLVWDQVTGLPGSWQGRLAPSYELIFHFNKKARKVNKITPAKQAHFSNKMPGDSLLREKDGTKHEIDSPEKVGQPYRIPDNVIRLRRYNARDASWHPAVYPVELPRFAIRCYSEPGQIVLDPFLGSGSTAIACVQTGRKFIGMEIDETYFDQACKRIAKAEEQPELINVRKYLGNVSLLGS